MVYFSEKATSPVTQTELQEIEKSPTAEPNILETLKNILSDPQAKAKVKRITPLSVVKSAFEFLEQYNITMLSKLQKTLAATKTKFDEVNERTKAVEGRLKKLNPLTKQADDYLQHREINKLYKQQKPKHKDKFFETYRRKKETVPRLQRVKRGRSPNRISTVKCLAYSRQHRKNGTTTARKAT